MRDVMTAEKHLNEVPILVTSDDLTETSVDKPIMTSSSDSKSHSGGLSSVGSPRHLKYLSLIVLTLQNAALMVVMRYVRVRPGDMFVSSTAVVMSEVLKVSACLLIIWFEQGRSIRAWLAHLNENIIQQKADCVRVSVPAFVYMLQNNLLYVAASHLEVATFQVTYQLKILTTAVLSVMMLRKHLTRLQWVSLVLLFVGVAAVSIEANNRPVEKSVAESAIAAINVPTTLKPKLAASSQNPVIGLAAVLTACVMSGFAGVYFEKILKNTAPSIYVRNIQLGVVGGVLGLGAVFFSDGAKVMDTGFFFGYDGVVWAVIMLHAFGGIVVAVVVKYADNILKGFASSAAIILSCIASIYIFNFTLTWLFNAGAVLVIIATYMYSKYVPKPPPPPSLPSRSDVEGLSDVKAI